jgi:hypothetical protein
MVLADWMTETDYFVFIGLGRFQWFSKGAIPYFGGATDKSRKNWGAVETIKWATTISLMK